MGALNLANASCGLCLLLMSIVLLLSIHAVMDYLDHCAEKTDAEKESLKKGLVNTRNFAVYPGIIIGLMFVLLNSYYQYRETQGYL